MSIPSTAMSADLIALFEETTKRFNAEDWEGVADLCDPASLAYFRRHFLHIYTPEPDDTLTPEFYMQESPDMPREVAEYEVQRQRKHADPLYRLREDMPQISSLEELHGLTPGDLYAAYLRGLSPRTQIEKQVAAGLVSPRAAERALAGSFAWYGYRPIGVVMDGERIAHVVYQSDLAPESYTMLEDSLMKAGVPEDERELKKDLMRHEHPGLFTCRRGPDGEWRHLAWHNPFGMGSVLFSIGEDDSDSQDA
jgi:hypothetical protein